MLNDALPGRLASGWGVTRLDPDVRVLATATPPVVEPATARLVDSLWAEGCRQRPELFDGRVFVVHRFNGARIEGRWTRYRHVFAQLRHPDRFSPPALTSLAVNGLLCCTDGLVLGLRRRGAVYCAGLWQSVPAGSVEARDDDDTVDVAAQVMAELVEEVGVAPQHVVSVVPAVLILHPGELVADIGCFVTTALSFGAVEQAWRECGNNEYDALRLVRPDEVTALLRDAGPDLLFSASILLRAWLEQQAS